jgi:hypothetical protein
MLIIMLKLLSRLRYKNVLFKIIAFKNPVTEFGSKNDLKDLRYRSGDTP